MSREAMGDPTGGPSLATAATSAGRPRRTATSSATMLTAISSGVTGRSAARWGRGPGRSTRRRAFSGERVEDARDLGAAADHADVAEGPPGQRAHRGEVVGVSPGHDDDVAAGGSPAAARQRRDVRHVTSSADGNRSRFANVSRSSSTCTRKPTSAAIRARAGSRVRPDHQQARQRIRAR